MSVINSVLKDLDEKPTVFEPLEAAAAVVSNGANHPRSITPRLLLVTLFILLMLALLWVYYSKLTTTTVGLPMVGNSPGFEIGNAEPLATGAFPESVNHSGAMVIEPVPPMGSQIAGLHIRETRDHMELEFQLTQAASISLKQRSSNRYVFTLREVSSLISTPVISDNPWIREIIIEPVINDLDIRVDTRAGVLVDTEERREKGAFYWIIRLKKTLKPAVAAAPVANAQERVTAGSNSADKIIRATVKKNPSNAGLQDGSPPANRKQLNVATKVPLKAGKTTRLDISPARQQPSDRDQLRLAVEKVNQGNAAEGLELLNQLLGGEFDRDVRVHKLQLYQRMNEVKGFNQLLNESLQVYPADPVFGLYQANQLYAARRYADLINRFGIEQERPELISLVAASHQRLGQHDAAVEYFKRTLQIDPAQPKLWISLGISQQHLARAKQALEAYQMALRSGPLTLKLRGFAQDKIRQLSN
jgi:tetratricopeptide (TPR) repeat protein